MPTASTPLGDERHQRLYEDAAANFGAAVERMARSYEADPDLRQDLLQEMHFALWRSLATFDGRCSMRTWVYRVGHNVGATHVLRRRRKSSPLISIEDVAEMSGGVRPDDVVDRQLMLDRVFALLHQLKPVDRQIVLLYLDGNDAVSIGEITGISATNVATKISRLKSVLATRVKEGRSNAS